MVTSDAAPSADYVVCPYLGLADDPATHYAFPSSAQRCHSERRPIAIDAAKQTRDCLTAAHVTCPRYRPVTGRDHPRVLREAVAANAATAANAANADQAANAAVLTLERADPSATAFAAAPAAVGGAQRRRNSRRRRLAKILVVAVLAVVAGFGGFQIGSWVAAQTGGAKAQPSPSGLSQSSIAVAPASSAAATTAASPSVASAPSVSASASPAASGAVQGVTQPAPTPRPRVYVVKRGDSLIAIAGRFGVPVAALRKLNNIKDPNLIFVGQRIEIPAR
jgi:LysM repeat protein